jgi:hypothetical protein
VDEKLFSAGIEHSCIFLSHVILSGMARNSILLMVMDWDQGIIGINS